MTSRDPAADLELVLAYHEATKHGFGRFARSLGYLDWATQPDPFRRYEGTRVVELPLPERDDSPPYDAVYAPDRLPAAALTPASLSALLFGSLALSAWKQLGSSRWALRCNPSSGNLHPTEGYVICGPVAGLSERGGVWHYAPRAHALEERCRPAAATTAALARELGSDGFLVGLTSIHWRESWKYGERAYRYCQHDAGHAIAAIALAAAALGWRTTWLSELADDDVAAALGTDRAGDFPVAEEREQPDLLLAVRPAAAPLRTVRPETLTALREAEWNGTANELSRAHVAWDRIDAVAAACRKTRTAAPSTPKAPEPAPRPPCPTAVPARRLFRQRRSAVAMDGETAISRAAFRRMLAMTAPGRPPFDVLPDAPAIHLALFVHRVDDTPPGLYVLPRFRSDAAFDARLAELRSATRADFLWEPAGDLAPLHLLVPIDCRDAATRVSCDQDIAGDGAFSLGMIAEFGPRLRRDGAWCYRRLFWESGIVGQVLYLEAEAAGVRSTGIGCYYDDPVHELLGLCDADWQSLYHFTVGAAVDDRRLTTLPAYPGD